MLCAFSESAPACGATVAAYRRDGLGGGDARLRA
ncbi:hypothetical protein BP1026B_II1213 [Burkholderia pseudomallei 1026b]|uniref:Uncharacterized protein n=1 Tax=Burkholderia pseudomallei (strain 1026b) TaxID=884204 RepID=A0A0H3HZD9_BURP2|nr:hypothetical protein BP1026B_II1213 [Burkholderia pseudomallei 1026b]EIF60245.1 hypothetical protein BP1026A_2895 [Burkholderia pseudomallei 1026a]